jgi:AraC-like DNA-binding protein
LTLFTAIVCAGLSTAGLLVLSIVIRPGSVRSRLLCLIVLCQGLLLFYLYLMATQEIFHLPRFFFVIIPLALATGPLSHLYTQTLLDQKKVTGRGDWLHFVPLGLSLILLAPFMTYDASWAREAVFHTVNAARNMPMRMTLAAMAGVQCLYGALYAKHVWNAMKIDNPLRRLVLFFAGLIFLGQVAVVAALAGMLANEPAVLELTALMVTALLLAVFALSQRYPFVLAHSILTGGRAFRNRPVLSADETDSLKKLLDLLMDEERFYRDENLTLTLLSAAMETTPPALSRLLNEHYSVNFAGYVDGFRIREAMAILDEEPQKNALSIAYSVGFGSYGAFRAAFVKATGMTPARYRARKRG